MLHWTCRGFAVGFVVVLAACGPDGGGDSDGGGGGEDDGGAVSDASDLPALDRALVVTVNRDAAGADTIMVWTVKPDGTLVDGGLEFGPIDNPRRVAVRSDGREALVAWGTLLGDWGVVVIEMEPDGSAATASDPVVLGSGRNVFGLAYASDDHAIVALARSDAHELVALDRDGDGTLVKGEVSPVENEWPLQLVGAPNGNAVLHRGSLLNEPSSELIPLYQGGSGWERSGTSGTINPSGNTVVMVGDRLYCPTSDPLDPVTPEDLEAGGVLHVFAHDGTDVSSAPNFSLPRFGTMIAADPGRNYLVVPAATYELSPSDIPNQRGFRWQTVVLDDSGNPIAANVDDAITPSLLFNGLALTPEGVLVAARELYDDQAPEVGKTHPVQGYVRTSGSWQAVGSPHWPDGITQIAVSLHEPTQ